MTAHVGAARQRSIPQDPALQGRVLIVAGAARRGVIAVIWL
ncbi:MAG TPA: hypothetical protein VKS25_02320 [Solirubrobacteraceae bacterium]|nr:hypothetical protein [Solirubrobacteraceae bacterium]